MNRDELEGVLAHELSHVKNRDTLVMTIAVTLVGVVVLMGDFFMRSLWLGGGSRDNDRGGGAAAIFAIVGIVLLILAPLFAQLLQFAISRRREFLADTDAVFLTRHPEGMIGALEKLKGDDAVVRTASRATAHLWIESPIQQNANEGRHHTNKQGAWLNRMFNTHPPLDDRIDALKSLTPGTMPATPPA
jgi:heat shock protein HtpX